MDYNVTDPAGNEHVITGPDGASDEQVIQMAQQLLNPGAIESFGRGALNNIPLATQAVSALNPNADYSTTMSNLNNQAVLAKAAHPVAYGAGAVTGSLAPLAIPGVGEALEAAPVEASAALGAANAVGNTDIQQNPSQALKQGLEGAVTGGALGAVLPTGETAAKDLESIANTKGVQSLGLKPGVLGIPKEELEDLGNFAHETGLINGPLEQRVNTANDLVQQVGAQIGDIGAGSSPLKDATPFINELHDKIQESSDIFGAGANPEAPLYQAGVDKLSQPGLTFDQLQKMKTAIGQRAFDAVGNVKNDAAANLYRVYKDAMKSIISGSPEEYQDAMEQYGKLKDIHGALTNQWQKEQASGVQAKGFGMVGKLAGMLGGENPAVNVGAAAALAPAHPFMAMGALTPIATNPGIMSNLARTGAEAIPKAAAAVKLTSNDAVTSYLLNTLNTNPQKLGKYAQPLINAAKTGGSQGLAAQHFLLSQTHPDYNEMMLKQESNEPQ